MKQVSLTLGIVASLLSFLFLISPEVQADSYINVVNVQVVQDYDGNDYDGYGRYDNDPILYYPPRYYPNYSNNRPAPNELNYYGYGPYGYGKAGQIRNNSNSRNLYYRR